MAGDARRRKVEAGDFVLFVLFVGAAVTCFVPGVRALGDGKVTPGWILLAASWVLATMGFVFTPAIRTRRPHAMLSVVLSLSLGCLFVVAGYLEGRHGTPVRDGVARPAVAGQLPLIGSGATVIQNSSRAVNSPNVIARGPVTVNPPVNPNAPVITYDFNGYWREVSPGKTRLKPGRFPAFQKMHSLYEAHDWKRLVEVCEGEIRSAPTWLTPYLYSGVAYLQLGDGQRGVERLEYVERQAAGNTDYAEATRVLGALRGQHKPNGPAGQ